MRKLRPRTAELRGFRAGLSHSCVWSHSPLESGSISRKGKAYLACKMVCVLGQGEGGGSHPHGLGQMLKSPSKPQWDMPTLAQPLLPTSKPQDRLIETLSFL